MFTEEELAFLARATRTMQIIVGSLVAGVIVYLCVVLLGMPGPAGPQPDPPLLTYMSSGAAVIAIAASMIVPGIVARNQQKAILAGRSTFNAGSIGGPPLPEAQRALGPLVASYQTALIIRAAILEGPAFFCLTAYIIEHQAMSLAAAGMLLLFLLACIPTRARVENAIAGERTTIEQLRQMETTSAR